MGRHPTPPAQALRPENPQARWVVCGMEGVDALGRVDGGLAGVAAPPKLVEGSGVWALRAATGGPAGLHC